MSVHRSAPKNPPLDGGAYAQGGRYVFLTVRASIRTRPFVHPRLNQAVIEALIAERERSGCVVSAYCLMPDHLHILTAPRCDDVSVLDMIRRFKGLSTRVGWRFGWRGQLWQPRYYDRVLRRDEAVHRVAEYIIDNPVRKGLVATAEDYQWGGVLDPMEE